MNKTYVRSEMKRAGLTMNRTIAHARYDAMQELEKQDSDLVSITSQIEALEKKLRPLHAKQHRIKNRIRKEVNARYERALRKLRESHDSAWMKVQTAVTEAELIDARDAALVFIKQLETYEDSILATLKGEGK